MESRWSKARNGVVLIIVASAIYFLTLPDSDGTIQTVLSYEDGYKPRPFHEQRALQQPATSSVQEIEENGNFTIWANARFGKTVQYEDTFHAKARGPHAVQGLFSGAGKSLTPERAKFIEELDDNSNYDSSDVSHGEGGGEEKGDVRGDQDNKRRALERIRKEQEWFSLSKVHPRGGNALPNYLLRGIGEGVSPSDYKSGIVAFLHHNKAAGSSIKLCLNNMVNRGVMANHSILVVSSKVLSKTSIEKIIEHNAFVGGYTFGLCERYGGANCSYFTVMRNPYDRVLSSYFYCMVQPWDQLCGPVGVGNFTIQQWAIFQGSYFFYQLLMDEKFCKPNDVIADLFQYELENLPIPQETREYISLKKTHMCWLKQRLYLNAFLDDPGRESLLQNVLDNLEGWFSVIGLTEDFDLSLRMLSTTYDLPFYRRCRGKVWNKTPTEEVDDQVRTRERLKLELQRSPEVVKALSYDMRIFEKGKEIFRRQKEQLEILSERQRTTSRS